MMTLIVKDRIPRFSFSSLTMKESSEFISKLIDFSQQAIEREEKKRELLQKPLIKLNVTHQKILPLKTADVTVFLRMQFYLNKSNLIKRE